MTEKILIGLLHALKYVSLKSLKEKQVPLRYPFFLKLRGRIGIYYQL